MPPRRGAGMRALFSFIPAGVINEYGPPGFPYLRRPALVAAHAHHMGRHPGPAGHVLARRRHAADGPVARFRQHGAVRRRLLPAEFPRLAHVLGRNDRHGADRCLGHLPGHCAGRAAGPAVLVEHGAGLGLPAHAPADGRLPRDQRNGLRHAVHRGRRPGPVRRRAGVVGSHHGRAGRCSPRRSRQSTRAPWRACGRPARTRWRKSSTA